MSCCDVTEDGAWSPCGVIVTPELCTFSSNPGTDPHGHLLLLLTASAPLKGLCRLHYSRIFSIFCRTNPRPGWLFRPVLRAVTSEFNIQFCYPERISWDRWCLTAYSGTLRSAPLIRLRSSSWSRLHPSALGVFFSPLISPARTGGADPKGPTPSPSVASGRAEQRASNSP